MTIDCASLVDRLRGAAELYDRRRVDALCNDLIERIQTTGQRCPVTDAVRILGILRRKRLFAPMAKVSEALLVAGESDLRVRTEYAQALVDLGDLRGAENELANILREHTARRGGPAARPVPHKALALLGRVHKQHYVAMKDPGSSRSAAQLQQAIGFYGQALEVCPDEHWYGVNVLALAARARREGLRLPDAPDPRAIAGSMLAKLNDKDRNSLSSFDLASAAEASLALGDPEGAFDWLRDYVLRKDTEAFELHGTYRQLMEIWQLDDQVEPGRSVLPLLRHAIATRPGAGITLGRAELRAGVGNAPGLSFERAFGPDAPRSLAWYRAMMDAARGVAQIASRVEPDRGFGSGFLVRARDFLPPDHPARPRPDELLLLTNAHVVSNQHPGALRAAGAVVNFEALEAQTRRVAVEEVLWESAAVDAALLRLQGPIAPDPGLSYDLAPEHDAPVFAEGAHRRMFVIGHPGGGPLSISLMDSLQVGWDDPRVHYRTPTAPGSSGGPVFDDAWNVLALHHAALDERPGAPGGGTVQANEGIWIQAVRRQARSGGQ